MAKDFLWGEEFKLDVARGKARGASVRNIFGYNTDGTSTLRAVWDKAADYAYPSSAVTMTVTNDDAADDGGTILIKGLDANYEEVSEVVTTNNATPPTTTQTFLRINDVIYSNTGANAGIIDVSNGGVDYARIRAGDGRNQASIYTVPAGCEFYLYRIDAFSSDSTAAKPFIFRNYTRTSAGAEYNTARTTALGNMSIQRRLPFKYSEKTDIQLQMATRSGTHELAVFGEGILIKEAM
jgi:Tfp pilus assembly protein PilX